MVILIALLQSGFITHQKTPTFLDYLYLDFAVKKEKIGIPSFLS